MLRYDISSHEKSKYHRLNHIETLADSRHDKVYSISKYGNLPLCHRVKLLSIEYVFTSIKSQSPSRANGNVSVALGHVSAHAVKATAEEWSTGSSAC